MSHTDPGDERQLAEHAEALLAGLLEHLGPWAERTATAAGLPPPAPEVLDSTIGQLTQLLRADIDDQWTGPLELIRQILPDLPEQLRPAAFADIHASLHEPGLAWGAAKAHVHIHRHRSVPTVVVFAPDLGDRSRFDPYRVTHVRSAGRLRELATTDDPDLVIVDLDRTSDPTPWRIDNAHVIGFGSHVETERLDRAIEVGFDAAMARSVFFRRMAELLEPVRIR